jgi:DNA segregation ATPase FtsK/SpoIIIE-like protein
MRRNYLTLIPVGILTVTIAGVLAWFLVMRLAEEVTMALQVVIFAGAVAGVLLAVGMVVFFGVIGWEKWQQTGEQTKQARLVTKEYEVRVLAQTRIIKDAPAGHQVYLHDLLANLTTPLHLQAGPVNGARAEPWDIDLRHWGINQAMHATARPALMGQGEPAQLAAPDLPPLPQQVNLREHVFQPSLNAIFLGVGRMPGEVNPRPIVAPMERLVHIATAGSSGFGKSTFMQALAWQVLNAPDSRPVLMDAQGVTFSAFEGHPAMLARIASDEKDIMHLLDLLLQEMERRKGLFSQHPGVAKLSDYNARAAEPLPAIPTFFDEFGLVADNKAIAGKVRYIAQGGRKFGVYLVAGAQTWLASDISSALRSNLSTSVQFAARDKHQSRVLLSSPEAANITTPGRAFAVMPGQAGLIELQAPMIDEADLRPEAGAVVALPDPMKARAQAMHQAGASLSEIAREVLRLDREPGGRDRKIIKRLLGLDPDTDPENGQAETGEAV